MKLFGDQHSSKSLLSGSTEQHESKLSFLDGLSFKDGTGESILKSKHLINLFPLHFFFSFYFWFCSDMWTFSQMLMKIHLLWTLLASKKKKKNTSCKFCQWLISLSHVILRVNLLEARAKRWTKRHQTQKCTDLITTC